MGIVLTLLRKMFASENEICNHNSVDNNSCMCCSNNDRQELSEMEEYSEDTNEMIIQNGFFLSTHKIISNYYKHKNVGYFRCDIDGVFIKVSDNISTFIGLPKEENLQSISWVRYLPEDNYQEYTEWTKRAQSEQPYVHKLHFKYNNSISGYHTVHYYVIVEFHPCYNSNKKYIGLRGIMVNVPKLVWELFDEKDFEGNNNTHSH